MFDFFILFVPYLIIVTLVGIIVIGWYMVSISKLTKKCNMIIRGRSVSIVMVL